MLRQWAIGRNSVVEARGDRRRRWVMDMWCVVSCELAKEQNSGCGG